MARLAPIWRGLLVPWIILSIGDAYARDLSATALAETPSVVEAQGTESSAGGNPTATARAQYLQPPNAPESAIPTQLQHTDVSTSFDADSIGNRTLYAQGTLAPFSGIYESGIRFRVMGSANWYRFVASEIPRILDTGHSIEGGLLAGYAVVMPRFSVTFLAGPTVAQIQNVGDRWGAKVAIDMYATPTDLTMASGSISYSTNQNYFQVQSKAGLRIFDHLYIGPEAKFSWQRTFPQTDLSTIAAVAPQTSSSKVNIGAHISSVNIGPMAMGVSGGWVNDQRLGSGYYGGVNFYKAF
jgi:hypothetical protein